MSRDIFVQDLPKGIENVSEIPSDFKPSPIGERSDIIEKIKEVVPDVDFSEDAWGIINTSDFSIEINLGTDEVCKGFALHIHGNDSAVKIVQNILDHLQLHALDPSSDTGLFTNRDDFYRS